MKIACQNLPKYLHSIRFPLPILDDDNRVALIVDRIKFLSLVQSGSIVGVGNWNTLRCVRLSRAVDAPVSRISEALAYTAPAARANPRFKPQTSHLVGVFSPGRIFIRHCSQRDANRILDAQKSLPESHWRVRVIGRDGNRITKIEDRAARVPNMDKRVATAKLKTVYRESLVDTYSTLSSKRLHETHTADGIIAQFVKWDQGLTGQELRDGEFVSQETRDQRKKEREENALRVCYANMPIQSSASR